MIDSKYPVHTTIRFKAGPVRIITREKPVARGDPIISGQLRSTVIHN